MSNVVLTNNVTSNLVKLVKRLRLGETITLVDTTGQPLAILVGVGSAPAQPLSMSDWRARWETLAQRVGQAWQTDQSAIETLAEMRR